MCLILPEGGGFDDVISKILLVGEPDTLDKPFKLRDEGESSCRLSHQNSTLCLCDIFNFEF